ncbi:unnamed protein product [Blepharisma stoltei]|uniref:Uncharacterized protein n=1 Tax=Blepharisma stoltei TaxID=1481888 RepID=A0AAU9IDL5_9CILI|nr:unnamed protein product [Blepharisma stoltei]
MKNKRRLNELSVRLKFGFFFNGYTASCYYWEFIILYRKLLIICCSVFLANISVSIQALTVAIVLATSLHLQYRYSLSSFLAQLHPMLSFGSELAWLLFDCKPNIYQ